MNTSTIINDLEDIEHVLRVVHGNKFRADKLKQIINIMSGISGKINLAALEHAIRKTKEGVEYIAIPIAKNNLFRSEKGNVYLDFSGNEHIDAEKKQTHIINQSVPKEVYEKLKAAGEYAPTLGNMTDWSKLGGGEPTPNDSADIPEDDPDFPF